MTFLPIVTRELRVASRKGRTYWVRFFSALTAVGMFAWIWLAMVGTMNPAKQGGSLFSGLSGLAFAYCLFAGASTADAISEEKREGTLGLLFLTDLRGFDVVLGKLFATSLNLFYGLLSIFPLLAVPLLLGGVTGGEWWRMVLVLCVTLLFSLTCGILCSTLSRSDRKARGATVLFLIVLAGGIPLAVAVVAANSRHNFTDLLFWLVASPPAAFVAAYDSGFKPQFFWASVATLSGISGIFLAIASFAVPRLWQDNPTGPREARFRRSLRGWKGRVGWNETAARTRLLNRTAYLWIASRPLIKPCYVYAFLGVVGLTWMGLWFKYPRDMKEGFVFILTMLLLHTILKGWVASEATRTFGEDRRSGALELTLSTPLSVREIINGQIQALVRQFAIPVGVILFADACMVLAGTRQSNSNLDASWVGCCLGLMIVFVADLITLAWVGMWLGVSNARPERAAGGAIGRVLVLPWLIFFGCMTGLSFARFTGMGVTWQLILGLALVIALGIDLLFGVSAAQNLFAHFRTVATQRFDAPGQKRGWFRRA